MALCVGAVVAYGIYYSSVKTPQIPGPLVQDSARIQVDSRGTEFVLRQRSITGLPQSKDQVLISIGDITGGRVLTTVSDSVGNILLAPRHMEAGEETTLVDGQHMYQLALVSLRNRLIGQDHATFRIRKFDGQAKLTEQQKIDRLLASLNALGNAKFIRNGSEYSVAQAIDHLKLKRERAEPKTAQEFIANLATTSSLSGKPYRIKKTDGSLISSEQWFLLQLQNLEAQ